MNKRFQLGLLTHHPQFKIPPKGATITAVILKN